MGNQKIGQEKEPGKMSLSDLAENRYKTRLEETWHHEKSEIRSSEKIWYEQMPCKGGAFIAINSLDPLILQLYTPRAKNAKAIWEALKDREGIRADFMDGEVVIYFPMEILSTVADMAGAKRRRKLSEEHKAKLREVGKAHQFKSKNYGSNDP